MAVTQVVQYSSKYTPNSFQIDKTCYTNSSELEDQAGHQIVAIKVILNEPKQLKGNPNLKGSNIQSAQIR